MAIGHYPFAEEAQPTGAPCWVYPSCEPAEFKRSTQDWTRPELDGYTVWLVEWAQTIYLGETEWHWPDEKPGLLVFSVGGEVGP